MYALIVDKEKENIRGLKRMLSNSSTDHCRVFTAYSCRKAAAMEERLDLIFCDIAILRSEDFGWIDRLRVNNPLVQLVISGNEVKQNDTRRILRSGAADFLPKPYQQSDLESVLEHVEKVRAERENTQLSIQNSKYWRQNQISVQELFWKKLCLNRISKNPDEIEEAAYRVDIAMDKDAYYKLMVLTMKNQNEMWSTMGEGPCQAELQKLVRQTLFEVSQTSRVIVIYSRIVVIMESHEFEDVEARCQKLIQRCGQELSAEIICYIGSPVFCESIPQAYDQLLAYSKDDVLKHRPVVYVSSHKREENKIVVPASWADLLYSKNVQALVDSVRGFLIPLARNGQLTEQNFRIFQQDMLQMFFSYMERKELKAHELYDNTEIYKLYKVAILSIDGMCMWVRSCAEYILGGMYNETATDNERVIAAVKGYVRGNLAEKLCVSEIAEAAHLSPDYATKVFKKETGITIKEYVIQKRMEQAKKLLLEGNATVSEVALEVGYSNPSYFVRTFRSCFHITPKQLQKHKTEN